VRRLKLRIHRAAVLVFESLAEDETPGAGREQRRARVEIDLAGPFPNPASRQVDNVRDLQRTVENTIQVVLMGMRAKVAAPIL